jgi:hypothetical protein
MADSKIIYTPRADATPERERSALVAAYRYIIFTCRHETEKGAQRGAPDAAKESDNGCDAARIIPR